MKKLIKRIILGKPIKGEDIINKQPTCHIIDLRNDDKFIYNDIMNNHEKINNISSTVIQS